MKYYSTLFIAFIFQEPITSGLAMLNAIKNGVTQTEIFIIFIFSTSLDIVIGFSIGLVIRNYFRNTKVDLFIQKYVNKISKYSNKKSSQIFLLFVGTSIFPVSTILVPFLGYSFKKTFIVFILGEICLWYSFVWATVVGVNYFVKDLYYGLGTVALLIFLFNTLIKFYTKND
jgi:hypothetical protein